MLRFDVWRLLDSGGVIAQQFDDNSRELTDKNIPEKGDFNYGI